MYFMGFQGFRAGFMVAGNQQAEDETEHTIPGFPRGNVLRLEQSNMTISREGPYHNHSIRGLSQAPISLWGAFIQIRKMSPSMQRTPYRPISPADKVTKKKVSLF